MSNFRSEKKFQQAITDLFHMHGWLVGHTYDSWRSAPGEPDLRLIHAEKRRLIFAELKMPGSVPTWEQVLWLDALQRAYHRVYLWYPDDWDAIQKIAISEVSPTLSMEWWHRREQIDVQKIYKRWERAQVRKSEFRVLGEHNGRRRRHTRFNPTP